MVVSKGYTMTRDEKINEICSIKNDGVFNQTKAIIDEIYDDFESRTCDNCIFLKRTDHCTEICGYLEIVIADELKDGDFGCNRWETKQ